MFKLLLAMLLCAPFSVTALPVCFDLLAGERAKRYH
jgi:hypothetical protein